MRDFTEPQKHRGTAIPSNAKAQGREGLERYLNSAGSAFLQSIYLSASVPLS